MDDDAVAQLRLDMIALAAQMRAELAARDERLREVLLTQSVSINRLRLTIDEVQAKQRLILDVLVALATHAGLPLIERQPQSRPGRPHGYRPAKQRLARLADATDSDPS